MKSRFKFCKQGNKVNKDSSRQNQDFLKRPESSFSKWHSCIFLTLSDKEHFLTHLLAIYCLFWVLKDTQQDSNKGLQATQTL